MLMKINLIEILKYENYRYVGACEAYWLMALVLASDSAKTFFC